jgi:hypothetical protein
MMKLKTKHPPQKNDVQPRVITPDNANVGTTTITSNSTQPIDFAALGCCPKRYLQMEKRWFLATKPSSAPVNAPKNKVTDMSASFPD